MLATVTAPDIKTVKLAVPMLVTAAVLVVVPLLMFVPGVRMTDFGALV